MLSILVFLKAKFVKSYNVIISPIKKTLTYKEQDIEKVEQFKHVFEKIKDKSKIVYLDESGINKNIYKTDDYAPRGKKLQGKTQGKRERKTNIIAGLCQKKLVAPCYYEKVMNKERFNTYIQAKLLPAVEPGSTFIMDNASFHRLDDNAKRQIKEKKCEVLYLSPYSPELNKIEQYWAIMKKHLKKYKRVHDTLEKTLNFVFENKFNMILRKL